jgi:hypothetical protein
MRLTLRILSGTVVGFCTPIAAWGTSLMTPVNSTQAEVKGLSKFCAPNPQYHNFRVCLLSWLLHYETTHGGILYEPATGAAVDLGKQLGIDLQPSEQYNRNLYFMDWRWVIPKSTAWDHYVFCNFHDENVWRTPGQGGDTFISWGPVKSGGWEYTIGRLDDVDVGERVYYVLVHKDDRRAAIDKKVCLAKAPND